MKLRLTGAVAFSAALYAQLVGILFSVLIARKLSTTDFGLWAYVGALISYSLTPVGLVGGWISRDAARGEKVMYPSLMVSSFLVASGLTIYIAASTLTHSQIGAGLTMLLAGLLILVPNALANIATAIASGYTPHHVGLGSMLFETVKLVSAFTFVVLLGLSSLPFVFLAVGIGHASSMLFLLYAAKGTAGRLDLKKYLRKWLRGSIVNAVMIASGLLFTADVILISLLTGGTVVTAYWQAATVVGLLVNASSYLAAGLYPRLLSGGGLGDADKSLHFTLTLAVPILFGSIALSDYILSIVNPVYSVAWMAASLMALTYFIGIIMGMYNTLIIGTEQFDLDRVPAVKEYLKSRLALGVYVNAYTGPLYLSLLAVMLLLSRDAGINMQATSISAAKLAIALIQTAIYRRYAKTFTGFKMNLREVAPYFVSSLPMTLVVLVLKHLIGQPPQQLILVLRGAAVLSGAGALTYFAVLYCLSGKFRLLVREAIQTVRVYTTRFGLLPRHR
ncbi:MAG: hypothetical protein QW801_01895 [Candidatus Caldarchaeum sp.]